MVGLGVEMGGFRDQGVEMGRFRYRCVRLEAALHRITSKYRESDTRAEGSLSFRIILAVL